MACCLFGLLLTVFIINMKRRFYRLLGIKVITVDTNAWRPSN